MTTLTSNRENISEARLAQLIQRHQGKANRCQPGRAAARRAAVQEAKHRFPATSGPPMPPALSGVWLAANHRRALRRRHQLTSKWQPDSPRPSHCWWPRVLPEDYAVVESGCWLWLRNLHPVTLSPRLGRHLAQAISLMQGDAPDRNTLPELTELNCTRETLLRYDAGTPHLLQLLGISVDADCGEHLCVKPAHLTAYFQSPETGSNRVYPTRQEHYCVISNAADLGSSTVDLQTETAKLVVPKNSLRVGREVDPELVGERLDSGSGLFWATLHGWATAPSRSDTERQQGGPEPELQAVYRCTIAGLPQ